MGCCCSCIGGGSSSDDATGSSAAETELQAQNDEVLSIARGLSAPSIDVVDRTKVSGHGLALSTVVIEQDAAYWEVHVETATAAAATAAAATGESIGRSVDAMFGVATKKDRKFYQAWEESEEDTPETNGTLLMRQLTVRNGDVVGVAVQQSDLPMVQLLLNGELVPHASINRFRGAVHPALYLPAVDTDDGAGASLSLRLVFREVGFHKGPPSSRFAPVMVARGLV